MGRTEWSSVKCSKMVFLLNNPALNFLTALTSDLSDLVMEKFILGVKATQVTCLLMKCILKEVCWEWILFMDINIKRGKKTLLATNLVSFILDDWGIRVAFFNLR